MATKTRGETIKRDVAGSGFLNHVSTNSFVPPKYDPAYYRILHDLGFKDLACDKQIIAWQIATTTIMIYRVMDESQVYNEVDRQQHREAYEELPKLQKTLISLVNALNGRRPTESQPDPEPVEDLQEQLSRLMGGNDTDDDDD